MSSEVLVAVVEDDPDVSELLCNSLRVNGFETVSFSTAADFRSALKNIKPKINLIDLGLPDQDGLMLVRELSYSHDTATIIITAREELSDKIICLELGADDYIIKPFEPKEVIARLRTVLRRMDQSHFINGDKTNIANFDDFSMNFDTYELSTSNGIQYKLSRGEADILRAFLSSPNKLLSRETLMDRADIDMSQHFDRSIDVRISRLRNKIEADPKKPKYIKTVYGVGYLFVSDVTWDEKAV